MGPHSNPLQPFRDQRLKENPAPEREPGKYAVLGTNELVQAPQNAPQRGPKSNKNRFKNDIQRKLKFLPPPKLAQDPQNEGQKGPQIQPKWVQKRH